MKNILVFLIVLIFTQMEINAQSDPSSEFASVGRPLKFFQDILSFSTGKINSTRLDVFSLVPNTSLQFVKSENGFTSRYSVTISVMDKNKKNMIQENTWNEKVVVNNFEQTTSNDNSKVSLKSFFIPPGEYFIRSAVHDQESNTDFLLEKEYKVRDLSIDPAISDIMILAKKTEDKGINKISPNISGDVIVHSEGLPVFYEIYSKFARKLNIDYILTGSKKEKVFKYSITRDVDSGRTQIFQTIQDSSISMGSYTLDINLKDMNNKLVGSVQKLFISRWIGVPALITDVDKAVDEMIYIASPKQIDSINSAPTKDEKLKRFLAYWKKISPTPESNDNAIFNEYFRRVNYANEHFSRYYEGWRSDMGMVFILLGVPDNIERHPFDIDSKPYEIWEYYNLNQSFAFIDRTGFGDYRLVTPLNGDLYRFRM